MKPLVPVPLLSALRVACAAEPAQAAADAPGDAAPAGSADAVPTFRNVHNWIISGNASAMLEGVLALLEPGGVLRVVDAQTCRDLGESERMTLRVVKPAQD